MVASSKGAGRTESSLAKGKSPTRKVRGMRGSSAMELNMEKEQITTLMVVH